MTKFIYSFSFVLALLVLQSESLTVIKNVTVSSDIIQQLFFTEVQQNFKLSPSDTFETVKCVTTLNEIVSLMPALNVLPFLDSWGSIPSGLLKFHFVSIGNFDQCLDISADFNNTFGEVNGQHCFASIPLLTEDNLATLIPEDLNDEATIETLQDFVKLRIGVCVPDICTPEILTYIFQNAVESLFNESLPNITVSGCNVAKKDDLQPYEVVGITILSIFAGLIALSSMYDILMMIFNNAPNNILLAFSIFANGKKLFAINTKKSSNSIDCLNGIRVLSMVWVIYGHVYLYGINVPFINTIDILSWYEKAWSLHVLNATVSVDTFLFISGILVAWLGFRELDKSKGKLNILMMYVHRYIRLTPPLAGVIIFLISAYKFLFNGPFQETLRDLNGQCYKNWWVSLIYIQNYLRPSEICVSQSWYLAVDFHLYILSPLLLIPMWKWGKKFSPVLVVLGLVSIGCAMGTIFSKGYTDFIGISNPERMKMVYFPTHTRYSVWLVGFGLGYFMHVNRNRTFKPPKLLQLLGWIVSFTTIVAILFGTYFSMESDKPVTVFESAIYESLKRVSWSIALAWIVFACQFGFGGVVNTFLGHPFWQPLSRLTYSLYLVHVAIIGINLGSTRTDTYFSNYNVILQFWSTFGISLMAAIALTFAFEAPVLVLEKAIFRRDEVKKTDNVVNKNQIITTIT